MRLSINYGRTFVLTSLLGFSLAFAACGAGPASGNSTTALPVSNSTPTATSAPMPTTAGVSTKDNGTASTFTYASIAMTIISVEQKAAFSDDDSTSNSHAVVRINTKEHNTAKDTVYPSYNDNVRLVLTGGKSIAPSNEKSNGGIPQEVVRDNWIDFPVDAQQDVNTLILRVGGLTEHQMDISLAKNSDLSKYQEKSITSNAKLHYGVDWTLTKATASLSTSAKQAEKGKRYIIVELNADNTTADVFFPFPSDNFRLKTSSVVQAPADSMISSGSSIPANSKGSTVTVTFLMPEGDANFTLDFLAQSSPKINEATADFQIAK